MSLHELYVKDARVWIPHEETVWTGAIITRLYTKGEKCIYIRPDAGSEEIEIEIKNEEDLPPLRNPTILLDKNDLTSLSYLHEPDVLYNLQIRFCDRQTIYTYCGIVLVAINPYFELPLYGHDLIQAYRGHPLGELEPHIFAIAEDAYTKLEREKCNLSIIVSGESGAGKTVNAKYAMRYFAVVGGSESETNIERKVLASSPIMEAIGNAKTTRNDNSSRFGKFTKLLFSRERGLMGLTGATMNTYLLEKSRVVFQTESERNYHIFYQLCAARDQWPELMLDHPDKFYYLNQGDAPVIPRVCDLEQYGATVVAFEALGFSKEDINEVMTLLAAILHLGNIVFKNAPPEAGAEDCCQIDVDDLHLAVLCDLLRIDINEMRCWLTTRQIESVNEVVNIPMNLIAAENARDALSKHVYARLFQHIVDVVNRGLSNDEHVAAKGRNVDVAMNFIGVLDIYGFETFDVNSFEQFCINYANEKLQQQFNQHVFKLEQDEYLKEGIEWTMIDFYDNQPCIDLIESKLGVLDLLDEECRMPRGSDESWVVKLGKQCSKYKHFEKSKFDCGTTFMVKHFSGTVPYDAHGFIEKNRDTVSKELVNVLVESGFSLCRQLMLLEDVDHTSAATERKPGVKVIVNPAKPLLHREDSKASTTSMGRNRAMPSRQHKKTVGSQFRESLSLLIATLHSTTPNYVRCIKPNDNKAAFEWEPSKIVQQLRACGVLETVRISAAGFPSRWYYEDFIDRYHLLGKEKQLREDDLTGSAQAILKNWITDEDKVRFGKTQIFFRAGVVAYLEQQRADVRKRYIIIIQSLVKRFIYKRRYERTKKAVLGVQKYARGMLARRLAESMRQTRAAILIQRNVRGWLARLKYNRTKYAILRVQARCRGYLTRKKFKMAMDNHKATTIQRYCRGYLARRDFKLKLKRIINCQASVRRFLARRQYKRLKAEARTVYGIKKKYMGLENKIISMQQRMDVLQKENVGLKKEVAEIPELKAKLEFIKLLENEMKDLRSDVEVKSDLISTLQHELMLERDEKMQICEEKNQEELQWNNEKDALTTDLIELQKRIVELEEKTWNQSQVDDNKTVIYNLQDDMQEAYQRTVREKELLDNENMQLRSELKRLQMQTDQDLSMSNASETFTDEGVGNISQKSTLEMTRRNDDRFTTSPDSQASKVTNFTTMILRMRNLLEEEKRNLEATNRKFARYKKASLNSSQSISPEDRIRLSELEIENERLRKDYESLRMGIARGVENQVQRDHYNAAQDELRRRAEEIVQLKAVLAQQTQALAAAPSLREDMERFQDNGDLIEAFQAQKLVNRQLESELTALTEEHNIALTEFYKELDESRAERTKLQGMIEEKIRENVESLDGDTEAPSLNNSYLQHEFEKTVADYLRTQEQLNEMRRVNQILMERLRDHGLTDSIVLNEDLSNIAVVSKKPQTYQGIFKYIHGDEGKIIQRLVIDYTPKLAVTLLPGLPAYVILMCIRYTDLIDTDRNMQTLLASFITQAKKFYLAPHPIETRLVWLVNMVRMYNLLRQYGGVDEFIKLNTDAQNKQQLKNFDLSAFWRLIFDKIVFFYQVLVKQIRDTVKPFIVPALLEHDEMARSKKTARKSFAESVPDPTALVQKLTEIHQQFQYFGLEKSYTGQIFQQILYYICAVALNNLMLRPDLCTWRTGMKIRYNIGFLKNWVEEVSLPKETGQLLGALADASTLLQMRKSEDDVNSICDLCSSLTTNQILKIIKSYRLDEAEPPITPDFIERLTQALESRPRPENTPFAKTGNDTFTVDENVCLPLCATYEYSDLRLEDIELPSVLNLKGVLTKI